MKRLIGYPFLWKQEIMNPESLIINKKWSSILLISQSCAKLILEEKIHPFLELQPKGF